MLSRTKPLSVSKGLAIRDHDGEGRLITAEFDHCYVINVYVPNRWVLSLRLCEC